LSVILSIQSNAQGSYDSLRIKAPRHYFKTVILLDLYRKPSKNIIDTMGLVSRRLKSYGVKQSNISFYTPVYTHVERVDSIVTRNTHVLITGNLISLQPVFENISQHKLVKLGIGARYIYNSGKKSVWFFDISPFITKDVSHPSKGYFRMASSIIYSHNHSYNFNWRLGVIKSFMWGNRYYLPFIGLRFGRLDKVNLTIQIPRNIQLNVPLSDMWILSLYTRPLGGMYNFSNNDSLYKKRSEPTFHFTRYEINTGLRCDARFTDYFYFYFSAGISSKNTITFYSETANPAKRKLPYNTYFYSRKVAPSLFFNLGLVLRFGKTRNSYHDKNLYDAIDLNNATENIHLNQVPIPPKKQSAENLNSIQDLIDYNDF
jgi:hypothetical protein